MKIIDCRVRPPYKSIGESFLWAENRGGLGRKLGSDTAPSVKEKSMELLLQEMDALNIQKGVVTTRKLYNNNNHDLLDLLQEYPDRFIAVPNIDPKEGQAALEEIDELVGHEPCGAIILENGIAGMGIGASADGEAWSDHDKRIYPVYEKCMNENIPVLLTCSALAYGVADANIPMHIDIIAKDFPKLKIMVAHAAWPWVQSMCGVAFKRANVYLSPDVYMMHAVGYRDYIDAANYLLQDKMTFGSAYPGADMKSCIDFHFNCGLREEKKKKIMYLNALSFFADK